MKKEFFVGEDVKKFELNFDFIKDILKMKILVEIVNNFVVIIDKGYKDGFIYK